MDLELLHKIKQLLTEHAQSINVEDILLQMLGLEEKPYQLHWKNKSSAGKLAYSIGSDQFEPCFSPSGHSYIVGDNLPAMQLLNQSCKGSFKCIYLDPPYNTGKSFVYTDKKTGGTLADSRAAWLTMIYPRLLLCKELLQDNGVLYISIDDHAQPLIRNLCDEIFGLEHFICTFVWKRSGAGGLRGKFPVPTHEYILCYTKNIHAHTEPWFAPYSPESFYEFKHKDEFGPYKRQALYLSTLRTSHNQSYFIELPDKTFAKPPPNRGSWRYVRQKYKEELSKGNIEFVHSAKSPLLLKNGQRAAYNIYTKQHINPQGSNPSTLLPNCVGQTRSARAELKKLMGADLFDYAKPVKLLEHLFSLFPSKDSDMFLDPFSGSGTSAHALLKLNRDGVRRYFVMIQQAELCPKESNAFRAGYTSISELGQERIRRSIKLLSSNENFQTLKLKTKKNQ